MKETRLLMGMPITVEVVDLPAGRQVLPHNILDEVFAYFALVDERFSTYKDTSEISRINRGEIISDAYSEDMQEVFAIAEQTKQQTQGYFDIRKPDGSLDPSGIVKGWAIRNATDLLRTCGAENFFIEAGGDIQTHGMSAEGTEWSVGIKNPFNTQEVIKVVYPRGMGVATSGSYERGAHIYNPLVPSDPLDEVVSITVIGPDVLEADRFATAAFAMGHKGVEFIQSLSSAGWRIEAYSIDASGIATMTSNFSALTKENEHEL
jgi:thiamine biosynthesis lipoprotein